MKNRYFANFYDAGNCEINEEVIKIDAESLSEAMALVLGKEPEDAVAFRIWLVGAAP